MTLNLGESRGLLASSEVCIREGPLHTFKIYCQRDSVVGVEVSHQILIG